MSEKTTEAVDLQALVDGLDDLAAWISRDAGSITLATGGVYDHSSSSGIVFSRGDESMSLEWDCDGWNVPFNIAVISR